MTIELEVVERETVELTTTAIIPAPVVGGVPPEAIRAWDAETLTAANEYTDAAVAALPGSDVSKAYVDAADGALGERIDALPAPDVDRAYVDAADTALGDRLDNIPTADVDKAYVDAQDQSIRDQIDAIPDPSWGDLADKPGTFPPSAHSHPISEVTGLTAALSAKSDTGHTHTKAQVGLGNVDNTSDASKPVSTAQQAALDGKASVAQGVPTGGTTGQVLAKTSGTNYATGWVTPTGGSSGITGPGRPDVPAGTGLANEIAAAPVGTLYNSTDGAGAGAWAWRKRPAGWVVVDGDTGLRRFVLTGSAFPANGSYVEYRRRQDSVFLQVNSTNAGAWRLNTLTVGSTVPVLVAQPGFRPSSGAMAELNNDGRGRLGAYLLQMPPNDGQGALQIRAFETVAANQWVRVPLLTWLTLDGWPATLPGIAV